ncbi:MAG: hypothetical protein DMF90_28585 [Acidobacteria bacterium]|nr:MAG: hypothetical protein DMF90_28585 [Acidobacteriota bacterium]
MRFRRVLLGHLLVTATIAAAFAWEFGSGVRAIPSHVLVVGEWDLALLAVLSAVTAVAARLGVRLPGQTYRYLLAATCTLQAYLYTLNVVSHVSWDRNMTAHLVMAFAPTVWSGREPFPVGPIGIVAFGGGTCLVIAAVFSRWGRPIDRAAGSWLGRSRLVRAAALAVASVVLFAATLRVGIGGRDSLYWKQELVSSFFRPEGFAFEPSARRHAVAAHDAVLRATYPAAVPGSHDKHVVLIIVDSLRADHMQVYGYERPTTPFLSSLVDSGRMNKVRDAFSTCSESFCGITSTLSSREFQDISAETFQLQDVLRRKGYQAWFLLSGNHRAWNGLPRFYHAVDGALFDGSQSERYTMDDDRLVLEGLERVPPASPGHPAFFYVHLMSTHYLGVQFDESHVFTRSDDRVSPGLEPYTILERLNKPDRYDDKVLQADGMIRQVFTQLQAKHYLDDAVVVVTGDHGEGLGERHWAHGWHLYNEDIRCSTRTVPGSHVRDARRHRADAARPSRPADSRLLGRTIVVPALDSALHAAPDVLHSQSFRRAVPRPGGVVQVHRNAAVRERGTVRPEEGPSRGAQSRERATGPCVPLASARERGTVSAAIARDCEVNRATASGSRSPDVRRCVRCEPIQDVLAVHRRLSESVGNCKASEGKRRNDLNDERRALQAPCDRAAS